MIILASKSKARQEILKKLGIKFKVTSSRIKEHDDDHANPSVLVKANALMKARCVASRLREGIVIGCDTVVEQKGRIFGKPKNLKEARSMLKKLTSNPHYVYTGIAVINIERRKEFVAVEKTRIIMERLSDEEINYYFKKVSSLDKAGGFDIQGLGGFFIKRIEGCYFNVVGLPVAKMFVLLKKAGVSLLSPG